MSAHRDPVFDEVARREAAALRRSHQPSPDDLVVRRRKIQRLLKKALRRAP